MIDCWSVVELIVKSYSDNFDVVGPFNISADLSQASWNVIRAVEQRNPYFACRIVCDKQDVSYTANTFDSIFVPRVDH